MPGKPRPLDADLLRALHDEYAAPLQRYVLRLVGGDHGRAEDVVQEALLRAWQHPESLDRTRGDPGAWLFTVARRLVVDQHRARRARPFEVSEAALPQRAEETSAIDRALEEWEMADALMTLSQEHRAVLLETYYRGRTVSQAATVLGVPPGTVKSRTFYALRALRLALEERGVAR